MIFIDLLVLHPLFSGVFPKDEETTASEDPRKVRNLKRKRLEKPPKVPKEPAKKPKKEKVRKGSLGFCWVFLVFFWLFNVFLVLSKRAFLEIVDFFKRLLEEKSKDWSVHVESLSTPRSVNSFVPASFTPPRVSLRAPRGRRRVPRWLQEEAAFLRPQWGYPKWLMKRLGVGCRC